MNYQLALVLFFFAASVFFLGLKVFYRAGGRSDHNGCPECGAANKQAKKKFS